MDTADEIPLEDHRYFRARLDHLETRNPAALLIQLETGTLTEHLRQVTARATQFRGDLLLRQKMREDQADELVMHQIVADPQEFSRLNQPASKLKLKSLLDPYRANMPFLPRTYQSQRETTE